MNSRKSIPKAIETNILVNSKRRCALCFGLKGDLEEKKGQIAHLDQNRSNNSEDNLAFLCFDHHDEYDSKTSQSKGLTIGEVKHYRDMLYDEIESRLKFPYSENSDQDDKRRAHDQKIFDRANEIISEKNLKIFLEALQCNDLYMEKDLSQLIDFHTFFLEVGNQFLSHELKTRASQLNQSIDELVCFLGLHFFQFPRGEVNEKNFKFALYPNLNWEREGDYNLESFQKYRDFQKQLYACCSQVEISYKEYRIAIKEILFC